MRSLDGKPLATSARVRIYRGFGGRRIRIRGRLLEVDEVRIVSSDR